MNFERGNGMHYEHSNKEVVELDTKTGKHTVWKICDVCGAQQKSNNGFTISYAMPGEWGGERHGYCNKCAKRFVPLLLAAIGDIRKAEEAASEER